MEIGNTPSPLKVVFQFNPVQLSRSRSLSYSEQKPKGGGAGVTASGLEPAATDRTLGAKNGASGLGRGMRDFHLKYQDLEKLRQEQVVNVQEETLSFEIRLDATDRMGEGDANATQWGVGPELATLELMMLPKSELGVRPKPQAGQQAGPRVFSFTKQDNPPLILFIWGDRRHLPVNINSMNITETEFNTALCPIRATVAVNLTVIEGPNAYYLYSKDKAQELSDKYLGNRQVVNLQIPPPQGPAT